MLQCIDDANVLQNKALQTPENEFFPVRPEFHVPT